MRSCSGKYCLPGPHRKKNRKKKLFDLKLKCGCWVRGSLMVFCQRHLLANEHERNR